MERSLYSSGGASLFLIQAKTRQSFQIFIKTKDFEECQLHYEEIPDSEENYQIRCRFNSELKNLKNWR